MQGYHTTGAKEKKRRRGVLYWNCFFGGELIDSHPCKEVLKDRYQGCMITLRWVK